jgi:hypothetical protein
MDAPVIVADVSANVIALFASRRRANKRRALCALRLPSFSEFSFHPSDHQGNSGLGVFPARRSFDQSLHTFSLEFYQLHSRLPFWTSLLSLSQGG